MMVMMQSPNLSDSGRPESPSTSSNPGSPLNNNNNSNTPNHETKYPRSDSRSPSNGKIIRFDAGEELVKESKTKFSVLSNVNKENSSTTTANRNSLDQILYPKPMDRDAIEPSAKFSIERLKQLADQRLSPSNIENSGLTSNKIYSIDHGAKYQNGSNSLATAGLSLNAELLQSQLHNSAFSNHHSHHLNILSHSNHLNNLKFGLMPSVGSMQNTNSSNNNNSSDLDIERIKLARTLSNGKELSDFGFRIQLGGLSTSYAHSETHSDSEELNVDGNEDSSQDGNSVSCVIKFRLIYLRNTSTLSSPNQFHPTNTTHTRRDFNCSAHSFSPPPRQPFSKTCPVDLTRSMDSKPSIESSEKETPKRLAFSVENILDPNKFTGKKHYGQGVNGSRMWNNIERDDKMDDDQSDDRSSEYLHVAHKKKFFVCLG